MTNLNAEFWKDKVSGMRRLVSKQNIGGEQSFTPEIGVIVTTCTVNSLMWGKLIANVGEVVWYLRS